MRIIMVKILLLVGNYLPGFKSGGALRSTVNMVERLGDEFEFWIVTSDRDIGDTSGYSGVNKNKWNNVGKAKVFYVSPEESTIRNISKIINNTEHDILYLNSFFNPVFTIYPLISRRFNRLPNKPVIVATRGEFAKGALSIKKWKKIIYIAFSNVFQLYKKVFWQASSEFEANDIRKAMKSYSPQVYIAPNIPKYLNHKSFDINIKKKEDLLKICFLGRIAPVKNLDYALKVLSKLTLPITFDIYGPKEDKRYWDLCKEIIDSLPKSIEVNYMGPIENENVNDMFQNYDLFFLPTKGENFGHVILESMSAGTPTLIADTTPWKNLEEFGVGWDISLSSPNDFANAIEKMFQLDEKEYLKMRSSVRNYAEKVTNDVSILNQSKELFLNSLGRGNV